MNLIDRLIAPDAFTFSGVLSIQPQVDFLAGLQSPSSAINLTTLSLLEKAKYSLSDIGIVAGQQEIAGLLVKLWLLTKDIAVAEKAGRVLAGLLLDDRSEGKPIHVDPLLDENLMWRRIVRDKNIYESFFSICSLSNVGQEGQPSTGHKSIAQGRLFKFLLVVRADVLRISQIPEIEQKYGVKEGGLLEFATLHMADYQNDDLMLSILIDFCADFLQTYLVREDEQVSPVLDFLKKSGLHELCMSYYLNSSASHASWVQSSSARYLTVYCTFHRMDLLNDPVLPDEILETLCNRLSNVTSGTWLSGQLPNQEMLVLAHLPPNMLLSQGSKSPLAMIPPVCSRPQIMNTLKIIFGSKSVRTHEEQAGARALFILYLDQYPEFWSNVVGAADNVPYKEAAFAANSFIESIINATWQLLPSTPSPARFGLPTEEWLSNNYNYGGSLPQSGVDAIMSINTAAKFITYFLLPLHITSTTVTSRQDTVESDDWSLAVAKFDVLMQMQKKIQSLEPTSPMIKNLIAAIGRRITQGPLGGSPLLVDGLSG